MYASETIQNCKNPTGHIDTLSSHLAISQGGLQHHPTFSVKEQTKNASLLKQ